MDFYFHIYIESYSKFDHKRFYSTAYDKSKEQMLNDYLKPYLHMQEFFVDGRILSRNYIEKLKVIRTIYKTGDASRVRFPAVLE